MERIEEYSKEWFVMKVNQINHVHKAGLKFVAELTLGVQAENEEVQKELKEPLDGILSGVNEMYEKDKKQLEEDWMTFYAKDYDEQTFQNFVDSFTIKEEMIKLIFM